ncbi:MAG TPA: enoyl-CoA hydratase/isomerase family protein [Gammaproteobacteria bacterium]|nr:enoyl-CoA hydratase/isomerase family protein [Gammaproteobacteria bacterium]
MLTAIRHDDVLELRLARPPVNALDPGLVRALSEALERAPHEGARAIVLSGAPGMFSAGLDIPALLALDRAAMLDFWRRFFELLRLIATSSVPVAAAITGHSPAGGAVLALYCDARFAADGDFKIGLNEVQVGLPLPPVIHAALVRQIGPRQAERLAVRGLLIDPREAERIGLVDRVVAAGDVIETALAWCREVLTLPPRAMAQTRELARHDFIRLFRDVGEPSWEDMTDVWFSEETQAALRAVMERLKKK